jgi:D-tyrosyl-tRNA(Tyr) deacylase
VSGLRIFADEAGKMNRSALDQRAEVLVVSQFTLLANVRRGRRPGFDAAERPERAVPLLDTFVRALESQGLTVAQGRFGAAMDVHLVNHGPATFLLDSRQWRVQEN